MHIKMLSKVFVQNFSILLGTKHLPSHHIKCYTHLNVPGINKGRRQASSKATSEYNALVSVEESRRFMIDCFRSVKVPQEHAEEMADLLVAADYRGHFSHGMNRLEMYINDLEDGTTDGIAKPKILNETTATAWVDGCNGLGAVVGNFCMNLAIKKAQDVGIGWISVKNSNHFGIASWYTLQAVKNGLIGIAMTNTSPLMAPTRSKVAALGTNPISIAAQVKHDKFVLDMATTTAALGKIEMQVRKNEDIPDGWAQDSEGNVTNNSEVAYKTKCLMPLGGREINSGYKGYGLAAAIDILCGVLAGANYSTKIRKWGEIECKSHANLGQSFAVIDPNFFAPGFQERLCDFNQILRNLPYTHPENPVLIPGDKENIYMEMVNKSNGIKYIPNQIQTCQKLSKRLNVKEIIFVKV